MRDFKGQELNVGDKVIYTMKTYGSLREGEIIKMNRTQCTIRYRDDQAVNIGTAKKPHWHTYKYHDRIQSPQGQCMKLG